MADSEIQAYIDQLRELAAAAEEARAANQGLGGNGTGPQQAGGASQPGGQPATGNGSLGPPRGGSEPLSSTLATAAAVRNVVQQPAAANFNLDEAYARARADRLFREPLKINGSILSIGSTASPVAMSLMSDEALEAATADQNPNYSGRLAMKSTFKQATWKTGLKPTSSPTANPIANAFIAGPASAGIYGLPGTDAANAYTAGRMAEDDAWAALRATASSAAAQGAPVIATSPMRAAGSRFMQDLRTAVGKVKTGLADITFENTHFGNAETDEAMAKGIGAVIGAIRFGERLYEADRDANFARHDIGLMNPGLARSRAQLQYEAEYIHPLGITVRRQELMHAGEGLGVAAAMGLIPGGQLPGAVVALASLGANIATKYFGERYLEAETKKASIVDLVRKYNLGFGGDGKTAEQRADLYVRDTSGTEAKFREQLEQARDDYVRGFQRVGLGDFGDDPDPDKTGGGKAFLKRAADRMQGIAPMAEEPERIFAMQDAARTASRQFASTNCARARSRTGD